MMCHEFEWTHMHICISVYMPAAHDTRVTSSLIIERANGRFVAKTNTSSAPRHTFLRTTLVVVDALVPMRKASEKNMISVHLVNSHFLFLLCTSLKQQQPTNQPTNNSSSDQQDHDETPTTPYEKPCASSLPCRTRNRRFDDTGSHQGVCIGGDDNGSNESTGRVRITRTLLLA